MVLLLCWEYEAVSGNVSSVADDDARHTNDGIDGSDFEDDIPEQEPNRLEVDEALQKNAEVSSSRSLWVSYLTHRRWWEVMFSSASVDI